MIFVATLYINYCCMNIDFVVYTPPKVNYDPISLWGEVIYIPRKSSCSEDKEQMHELFNCYRARREGDVKLTIEAARLETYGIPLEDLRESHVTQASEQF